MAESPPMIRPSDPTAITAVPLFLTHWPPHCCTVCKVHTRLRALAPAIPWLEHTTTKSLLILSERPSVVTQYTHTLPMLYFSS